MKILIVYIGYVYPALCVQLPLSYDVIECKLLEPQPHPAIMMEAKMHL